MKKQKILSGRIKFGITVVVSIKHSANILFPESETCRKLKPGCCRVTSFPQVPALPRRCAHRWVTGGQWSVDSAWTAAWTDTGPAGRAHTPPLVYVRLTPGPAGPALASPGLGTDGTHLFICLYLCTGPVIDITEEGGLVAVVWPMDLPVGDGVGCTAAACTCRQVVCPSGKRRVALWVLSDSNK